MIPPGLSLLELIESPFTTPSSNEASLSYSKDAYSLAETNKIPLTYLSKLPHEIRNKLPEYNYHCIRHKRLFEIAAKISKLFDDNGINYVIFKTLRPFPEYVSDIDVLSIGSVSNYLKMRQTLKDNGYLFMEKGAYCTTFKDFKTNFETEAMIDVYDEISVSRLIYLNKRNLYEYTERASLPQGGMTNVFTLEAEFVAVLAHSAIKENQYILAEYYTTLNYLSVMDQASINRFVDLIKSNNLVNVARWHLTITSMLHKEAHGSVPGKLVDLLFTLGGSWNISVEKLNSIPPYQMNPFTLVRIFGEKLSDGVFRRSFLNQLHKPLNKVSMVRLIEKINSQI